jgi:hypothetical protein
MNHKVFVSVAIALLTLSQPLTLAAQGQTSTREWSAVQALQPGVELAVRMKSGETVKGKLIDVSDAVLSIDHKNRPTDLERSLIQQVHRVEGKSRGKSALKGLVIGGTAGLGGGLIIYLPGRDDIVGWIVPALAVIGAGVGAALGAVFGKGRKQILVYESN